MKVGIALVFVMLVCAGCATSYQSKGFTGGFSETRLSEDTYRINFAGNAKTDSERAADFALLRAAELTRQNGYQYFVILAASDRVQRGAYTTPQSSTTNFRANQYGNSTYGTATTTTTGGQTYYFEKPRADITIMMLREEPSDSGIVYNAQFVERSIRSKYNMKN